MRSFSGITLFPALVLGLVFAPSVSAQKSLDAFAQTALQDLAASVDVISKNDRELSKIGKGYVDVYGLTSQELWVKDPDRVVFQGKKGILTLRYVTNPPRKLTEVATLRIRKVEDISKEPGKGDSIADFGVVTRNWATKVQSKWLRVEQRDGKSLQVFEVWEASDPLYKNTIWIDPATRTLVERIAHHRNPNKPGFKKRFVFSEPKQYSGAWVPTRVDLYNGEGKLAASMRYESIRVNSGLQDKLFSF